MREKLIELLRSVQYQGNAVHGYQDKYIQNSELADHLIANGMTIQKWIPVTERLPEDDLPQDSKAKQIKVLVAYMRNGNWVVRTNLRKKGQWYKKPDEWSWSVSDPISHWMPLPEPPKGE